MISNMKFVVFCESLFFVGRNCCVVGVVYCVGLVVDGEVYFCIFMDVVLLVMFFIVILVWDFNSSIWFCFDDVEEGLLV